MNKLFFLTLAVLIVNGSSLARTDDPGVNSQRLTVFWETLRNRNQNCNTQLTAASGEKTSEEKTSEDEEPDCD